MAISKNAEQKLKNVTTKPSRCPVINGKKKRDSNIRNKTILCAGVATVLIMKITCDLVSTKVTTKL